MNVSPIKRPRQANRPNGGLRSAPSPSIASKTRPGDETGDLLRQAVSALETLEQMVPEGPTGWSLAREKLSIISDALARVGANMLRSEQERLHLLHFAHHDELTGLPNRSLLADRLQQTLAQAERQNRQAALLMLDLDGFKAVNDNYGHRIGDQLLQRVAQRLLASTRKADTTARYGGDEFVVLLRDVDGKKSAKAVARKIHARLADPFDVGGHSIVVAASIGIAVFPLDATAPDDLMARADSAMYRQKQQANRSGANLRMVT